MNPRFVITFLLTIIPAISFAQTTVEFEQNGRTHIVEGQILGESPEGGMLFEGRDRQLWVIQAKEVRKRSTNESSTYVPFTKAELKLKLLRELPKGFKTYDTAHFLIAYNTSKAYAQWCGALYERLYRAFYNYWKKRGFKLDRSGLLIAVVFKDRVSFERYAREELGDAAKSVIGYYSLKTNRITSYDLTGVGGANARNTTNQRQINALLRRPDAERTVATVIHEATHQLAFNSNLQTRYADIPVWLSEGLAIYFETPDLGSRKGWRTIGAVNKVRYQHMMQYLPHRPENSLESLLVNDNRFRQTETAQDAYGEAWALCYFLLNRYPKQFNNYLDLMNKKERLGDDEPEQRLADFRSAFGDDLKLLDNKFKRFITPLRVSP